MTQQPHATQPTGGVQEQPPPAPGLPPTPAESSWAAGGVVFAGVLMLMNGLLALFQGISALAKDDVWARVGDYVYKMNLTGWGTVLVCLGALAAVTGAFILQGAAWARMTGIFLASLGMVAQFLFLPYAPVWSVIMIGIDFFVIWSLAVYQPARTV